MNKKRHDRKFQVNDRVWLKRPKGITGPAISETLWSGPYRTVKQVGENSLIIRMDHADQLKLALKAGEEFDWSVAGAVIRPLPRNDPIPHLSGVGTASSSGPHDGIDPGQLPAAREAWDTIAAIPMPLPPALQPQHPVHPPGLPAGP